MKVLLLNTYRHGGAGVAAGRLLSALQAQGTDAQILHAEDAGNRWPFYAERLSFLPYERDKSVRFSFSLANFGKDLRRHPAVQAADVLHLHWINQGFLSLKNIAQLARLGKPIIWTLHDIWAFTGGCHIYTCDHFRQSCGHCPYLRHPAPGDLSHRIWSAKKRWLPANIHFVTCSDWLRGMALSSSLLVDHFITTIPNPIDTTVFQPVTDAERTRFRQEKGIAPEARVILFVAMKISEPHKGFRFLQAALETLKEKHAALVLEIMVIGKAEPETLALLPYPVHALGLVQNPAALARVYAAADVFVTPTLADNLPNTVMESLACGTPVAGFRTGGVPEMVEHRENGYIADQGDSAALAEGIRWVLSGEKPMAELRQAARQKVEKDYANAVVAGRYAALYQAATNTLKAP
ncbi:MAG: glycosyltransferase [Saprospiraceae bacterium]